MRTFIADIIPSLQKYSQKLDNLTLLTNQHWVVVDEIANSKTVYIFRSNNELLISKNGRVEVAKWEYVDNTTLLLRLPDERLLFRHGFFDQNVLALKLDGREEYALMVNETRYDKELNSSENVLEFLQRQYIAPQLTRQIKEDSNFNITINTENDYPKRDPSKMIEKYTTDQGEIEVEHLQYSYISRGDKVYLNGKPATTGAYKIGFMWYLHIKNGVVEKIRFFGISAD